MSVPFSNTKLRVPKGFQNILEGLARECLRNQPENIFEFGAKYFEQLLQVREQTGHDPAIHGARLEDRFYNNDSFKSPSVDVGDPQQQDAALKIQTEYRRHAAEQEVADMQLEEAAIKIQSGFRGFQDRQKVLQMKDPEAFEKQQKELEKKTSQSQEEEVDIDLEDPEVANAAVKIQAGFKGYKARKEVKERKEQSDSPDKVSDIDFSDPEVNNAVVKIQAGFRGHLTRQEIKSKKSNVAMQNTQEDVDIDLNDPELQEAASKIQAGFRGFQARQEVKELMASKSESNNPTDEKGEEEEVIDIDLSDPEVEKAATKIQAGFKGYKARKNVHGMQVDKENDTETTETQQSEEKKEQEEKTEDVDIDLTDPDTEKAAMKIQAGFRGYKTRKEVKDQMESKQEETKEESKTGENQDEGIDIDLNDPEVEKAATKIQAGFKGYKTRKEYKDKADGDKEEESKVEGKEETSDAKEESKEEGGEEKKEAVDIDLNDPEVDKAAVKIQATFKGYKTRKDLKSAKGDEEGVDKTDTAAGDEKE